MMILACVYLVTLINLDMRKNKTQKTIIQRGLSKDSLKIRYNQSLGKLPRAGARLQGWWQEKPLYFRPEGSGGSGSSDLEGQLWEGLSEQSHGSGCMLLQPGVTCSTPLNSRRHC